MPVTEEWTKVRAQGRYAAGEPLLVRNRPLEGTYGYEVLSPFTLSDGRTILVDRGWVPNAESAQARPDVPPTPTGTVTVTGWLRPSERSLGRDLPAGQLASIDLPRAEQQLGTEPARILYLDDVMANVEAAHHAGWGTIYVTDLFDALHDLDRYSVVELWAPPPPPTESGGGVGEDGGGLGEDLLGGGAGGEDGSDAGGSELVEVVVGDDAAHDDGDVAAPPADLFDHERGEGHVGAGQHRQPDGVDVLVDGGGGDGLGSLEQTGVDHLVAGVAQDPRNDLDPPVVPVEADLGDQDASGH